MSFFSWGTGPDDSETASVECGQGSAATGPLPPIQPELGAVVQAAALQRRWGASVCFDRVATPGVIGSSNPGERNPIISFFFAIILGLFSSNDIFLLVHST